MSTATAPAPATRLFANPACLVPGNVGRSEFLPMRNGDTAYPVDVLTLIQSTPATWRAGETLLGKKLLSDIRTLLVLGGGCSGMSAEQKRDLLRKLVAATLGFKGIVFSGGTAVLTEDGTPDHMITEAAPAIRDANDGDVKAVGSFPQLQTWAFRNVCHGDQVGVALELDPWNGNLNFRYDANIGVMKGENQVFDGYEGDLLQRFLTLGQWGRRPILRVPYFLYNGGGVTQTEAVMSIKMTMAKAIAAGSTSIIVKDSGRKMGEMAEALLNPETAAFGDLTKALGQKPSVLNVNPDTDLANLTEVLTNHGLPHAFVIPNDGMEFALRTTLIAGGFLRA